MDSVEAAGHPIAMRVAAIRGRGIGPMGVEAGDVFRSDREIGAVCHWAAHTLLPCTTGLRFGGDLPGESEPVLARICCPDTDSSGVLKTCRLETDG